MSTTRISLVISAVCFLLFSAVSAKETSAYSTLKSAGSFAIGGVCVAGVTTREELAMRELRDGPRAEEQLRKLLKESTPAGQMYALFALRQLGVADYSGMAEPYRQSSTHVRVISGCIIHTDAMSNVVRWIDQWAKKIKTWEKT